MYSNRAHESTEVHNTQCSPARPASTNTPKVQKTVPTVHCIAVLPSHGDAGRAADGSGAEGSSLGEFSTALSPVEAPTPSALEYRTATLGRPDNRSMCGVPPPEVCTSA
eukprot:363048-Chlamydomonas_euryale.AAC.8